MATALGMALSGCATPPPLVVTGVCAGDGVEVHASSPVGVVVIDRSVDGKPQPVVRRELPSPTRDVFLALDLSPGPLVVTATGEVHGAAQVASAALTVPANKACTIDVQPAPGAPWSSANGVVHVPVWGREATVFLRFTAGPSPVTVPTSVGDVVLPASGSRALRSITLAQDTSLQLGDATLSLVLDRKDPGAARTAITIANPVFPAEENGFRDLGRPVDAIILPSPAWERALAWSGAGLRVHAAEEPWAFVAVPVSDAGSEPVDVVVTATVTAADGSPAPAFRPRLRSADGGTDRASVLLRVPTGATASAVLPVFLDALNVPAGEYTAHLDVTPLGSSDVLTTAALPLVVRRGNPVASVGFLVTVLTSIAGLAWIGRAGPRWLRQASTTDLMVNALFGTALFVVSSATDVLSMSVGAVLGPFASLFTGIVYDAGRTVLLATLLQLQPRPGTLGISVLCCWLGRGVLTGAISPPDLIYTGAAIALGEGAAWLSGLTRGRPPTIGRLSLAFAASNAILTLFGLWLHTILYRLNFAGWYIAMQVVFPGFLYVVLASTLALPFVRSLREVDA